MGVSRRCDIKEIHMRSVNLTELDAWGSESGSLNVIIETPKGSRNKFNYDPKEGLFKLSKTLPKGMDFPYDFGFVPSTSGEDGDPLDVLVVADDPAFPGCKVCCRLIGVIEAEQKERGGETVRNDRLIAVPEACKDENTHSLKELPDSLVKEMEHFFKSYHLLDGQTFKPLAHHGPKRAAKLLEEGIKRFRKNGSGKSSRKR